MNINYIGESESSVPLEAMERQDEELSFGPNDVLSGRHKLSFNHSKCSLANVVLIVHMLCYR